MNGQLSFINAAEEKLNDSRPPETIIWNPWYGCHKVSAVCDNCYMFARDLSYGMDPRQVHRTGNYNLPVRRLRSSPHKGNYKTPSVSHIYTCFTSVFFHPAADSWREEAWEMMRERSDCTFFMITKRPERIAACLPSSFSSDGRTQNESWSHISDPLDPSPNANRIHRYFMPTPATNRTIPSNPITIPRIKMIL